MRPIFSILLFSFLVSSCRHQAAIAKEIFPPQVGDTRYVAQLDDSAFHLCRPGFSLQYYNTRSWFKDHKRDIEQYFHERYKAPQGRNAGKQTGWLTIRFIINCEGRTGWFRLSGIDSEYQPFHFSQKVSAQLLTLTKALQGWQPATYNNKIYDSYQYVTFKLKKGAIECILP